MTANTDTKSATRSKPLTQSSYRARLNPDSKIQSHDVATLPRPGTSIPTSIRFHTTTTTTTTGEKKEENESWVTYLLPSDPTSLTCQLYATQVSPAPNNPPGRTIDLFRPPSTGKGGTEDDYSLEEKLRRERARMMSTGVTSYSWANGKGAKGMLVPFGGALWLLDDPIGSAGQEGEGGAQKPRKLVETNTVEVDPNDFHALPTNAPLLDAKISSDGSTIAFVAGDELYTIPTTPSTPPPTPRRITNGARDTDGKTNGVADYLAMEELDRADGFWLSPRGSRLAFEEVDESHIPPYRIVHQGEGRGLSPSIGVGDSQEEVEGGAKVMVEETRYPFAGARNPVVKFGVVDAGKEGSDVKWFDLTKVFGDDFYLAKVEWLFDDDNDTDSNKLVLQILNRRQNQLALLLLDYTTGDTTTLHIEKALDDKSWVNLNSDFRPLPSKDANDFIEHDDSFRFLWASERDGYSHLYILESSLSDGGAKNTSGATVVRRLTGPGEYICEEVVGVDTDKKYIYYMGTVANGWLERHLFRVSYGGSSDNTKEGSTSECLTASVPGHHECVLDVKAGLFVDTFTSTTHAPVVTVCKIPTSGGTGETERSDTVTAEEVYKLHDAAIDPRIALYGTALKPPIFHTFPSTDGAVTLQSALYLPDEAIHGKGPYPLVVATYGGPHVQYVKDHWGMTVDMRSQFLRTNGFAVLKVDNRGSDRRGLVFETPIYGNMGDIEVADQVAGVLWAIERGTADAERIAVSGWSYGGYMALKCLTDRADIFHAAISGAPVTDWALYDTAYTERYMGLPQENPDGYAKASALANVKDMEGSLLLCHGLLDENVLFRQSAVLVNALIEHQKAFDLSLFPSERHGPRRPRDRAFLEERILAFLQRTLGV